MFGKIVIEVGSTATKIDLCNENEVKHLETYVIFFKTNYAKQIRYRRCKKTN